jgi:hypothetical protein
MGKPYEVNRETWECPNHITAVLGHILSLIIAAAERRRT